MIYNPNQTQSVAIEVTTAKIEASKDCIYDYVKVFNGTFLWLFYLINIHL